MKNFVLKGLVVLLLFIAGCKKQSFSENLSTSKDATVAAGFLQYTIPRGQHYAASNPYKVTDIRELKFTVRFDSSAIYQTENPQNQWDINKLYGFADNGAMHHQFSARIGWRWSEGALRLFAYTYNNGGREEKEITTISIGKEVICAIKVNSETYLFSVGGKSVTMPRLSTAATAKGYQLYPYFGGNEKAPHDVRIWIREEKF